MATPVRTAERTDGSGAQASGSLLQRVIAPRAGDPLDVRALYLDEDKTNRGRTRPLTRTSLRIPPQSEVSFATYFNAFPASYWRRWTTLQAIELRLAVDGCCRVDVYRSRADGRQIHVCGSFVEDPTGGELSFELDLGPFSDGGWYWFDITSEAEPVELRYASWHASTEGTGRGTVAVGMTTFNRPTDCLAALRELGEDPLVLDKVSAVFVADQGNRKVSAEPGFDEVAARLGGRLRVIDQPNLGGSGGFARAMYETLTGTDAEAILIMDDDIVVEPDAILRAVAFASYTDRPTIVGGQMLNLQVRSQLHSMGEVVEPARFIWRPAPHVREGHDFAHRSLRGSKELHRRIDVDYNGWWMCLIPVSIVERVGMPLPLFIKWDDAEYGLRAGEAGFPTVTLPGVAIWHMPWTDKDDTADWQAYFHVRNRLVAAALHSRARRGARLVRDLFDMTLEHLGAMQYSTAVLREMAVRDFMSGPDALFGLLPTALGEARRSRGEFDDAVLLPASRELPAPSMDPLALEGLRRRPTGRLTLYRAIAAAAAHNLRPVPPAHLERPQLNLGAREAQWFVMSHLDSATVATADGSGVSFRRRDRGLFWRLLGRAVVQHVRLWLAFPRLTAEYRRQRGELTGLDAWARVFEVPGRTPGA